MGEFCACFSLFVVRVNKQLYFECTPKPREGASGIGRERREGRRGRGRERVFFPSVFFFAVFHSSLSRSLSLSLSFDSEGKATLFIPRFTRGHLSIEHDVLRVRTSSLAGACGVGERTNDKRKKEKTERRRRSIDDDAFPLFFACTDAAAPLFSLRDMDAGAREYINKLRKRQRAWEKAIARERERVSSLLVCLSRSIAAGPSLVSPSPSLSLNPDPTNENKGSASLSLLSHSLPLLLK